MTIGEARAIYTLASQTIKAATELMSFFRKTVGSENALVQIITPDDVTAAAVASRMQALEKALSGSSESQHSQ